MSNAMTAIKQWSRLQKVVVGCSLLYAVVFICVLILHPGGPLFNWIFFQGKTAEAAQAGDFLKQAGIKYKAFQNTYQILPPTFAAYCAIVYSRKGQNISRTRRIGWLCIGLGCLSWAIGQSTWTYYESILGLQPFPSAADIGYFGACPLLIIGVALLFESLHVAGRARLLMDSAIAASSFGVLSWYFLIQQLWQKADHNLTNASVPLIAYPLSDIATLFMALVLFNGVRAKLDNDLRRSSILLALGIGLLALADSTFSYYNLKEIYQTGSWFDWEFSFGWLLIGYAALVPLWWPQTTPAITPREELPNNLLSGAERPVRMFSWPLLTRVLMPYAATLAAFAFVAIHDYSIRKTSGYYLSNTVVMMGTWLISLVILRQVLTLLENQHLTTVLRVFNERLEQMVERRTQQLIELHELTKSINTTLVEDEVLTAAVKHTQQAMHADAVILRLVTREEEKTSEETMQSGVITAPIYLAAGVDSQSEIAQFVTALPVQDKVEIVSIPPELTPEKQAASYLLAPLLFHQQVVGMIGVVRWSGEFGRTEPETLESIGLEVGIAYENARRYRIAVEAADRDAVTGLYNHRAIHQRLEAEFNRAARTDRPLSLMMMDLNNFKLFNDTYGHPVGDQVLKRVAHVLQTECRTSDILGRYGGDEFLVVLPDTDEAMALLVAQRLRDRMLIEEFRSSQQANAIPVTLSCGIATYPHDGTNRHELLAIADSNLYNAKLSKEGIVGTTETQRTNRELRAEESFGVLDAMVTAVDNKDSYTRRHSEDVTEYALWIAEELGLSEETMRIIRIGGLLHDVGKIGVPDEILRKPGHLTSEEYEVMKRHPQLGALIVGGVPGMEVIVDAVRYHHERWDGKGYPDSLVGEAIPLLGRILAVPDAFSAMTTHRAYRKGLEWESALTEIRSNIGTQFDPQIARAFLIAAEKRRPKERVELRLIGNEPADRPQNNVAGNGNPKLVQPVKPAINQSGGGGH